jgi:hypothetical protein
VTHTLAPEVALFYDQQWNGITGSTRGGKTRGFGIDITRGRSDEAGQVDPTRCDLTLNNLNGRFSPRNPRSDLFEKIGRNTQLQVFLGVRHTGEGVQGETSTSHVAPSVDAAQASLLIAVWAGRSALDTYTIPGSMTQGSPPNTGMTSAYETVGAGPTGTRTATTATATPFVTASVLIPGTSISVDEVIRVDGNSALGSDAQIVTSDSVQVGQWLVAIQFLAWSTVSQDRFPPDTPYGVPGGWIPLADSEVQVTSELNRRQLRVWGRRVTTPGHQEVNLPGIVTNQAEIYVLSGDIEHFTIRTTVEVSEWPQRWDQFGKAVWVPLQGSGVMRRLGSGLGQPARDAIHRFVLSRPDHLAGYWSLDDVTGSIQAESALSEGKPLILSSGSDAPEFGGGDLATWLPDSVITVEGTSGRLSAKVEGSDTGFIIDTLYRTTDPSTWGGGAPQDFSIIVNTSFIRWTATVSSSSGNTSVSAFDTDTSSSIDSTTGTIGDLLDGNLHHIRLEVRHNLAASGTAGIHLYIDDDEVIFDVYTIGVDVFPFGRLSLVWDSPSSSFEEPVQFGRVAAWGENGPGEVVAQLAYKGFDGEFAADRIARVCGEDSVAVSIVGNPAESVPMGPQPPGTTLQILREAELVDGGILYEPREFLGLAYRTVRGLYNQEDILELDYENCAFRHPLEPTDDDRFTVNDFTATKTGTNIAVREVEETGPLSVVEIGRYSDGDTFNVMSALSLGDNASWQVHLGTVDEARYPVVRIHNLAPPDCPDDPDLFLAGSAIDVGDRGLITNLPDWLPPEQVAFLAQGFSEHLDTYEMLVEMNTAPASPYEITEVFAPEGASVQALQLASGINSTTAFSTVGPLNPADGSLVLVAIVASTLVAPAPLATDMGIEGGALGATWVRLATQEYRDRRRLYLFAAQGNFIPGDLLIFSALHPSLVLDEFQWSVTEFRQVNPGNNTQNSVSDVATDSEGTSTNSLTVTIGGTPGSGDATYVAFGVEEAGAPTLEAGWELLSSNEDSSNRHLVVAWDPGQDQSPTISWTSNANGAGGIGLIIKAVDDPPADADDRRIVDSDDTTVVSDFQAGTDTTLVVQVANGQPLWSNESVPFDIFTSGVRLTVTNVADQAAAYRDSTSATSVAASYSITAPTLVEGDLLLLLQLHDNGDTEDMGTPTGGEPWLLVTQGDHTSFGSDGGFRLWWKIAGASEPGSYGLTQDASADGLALCVSISDPAAGNTPMALAFPSTGTTGGTSIPTPGTSPRASLELRFGTGLQNSVTFTPPAGFTEREDVSTVNVAATLATRTVATVDPGGTGVHDFTATGSLDDRIGLTVNVTGTQELTVTQAPVNGIEKVVPAGSDVNLFHPSYFGL